MKDFSGLVGQDLERLMLTIEASLEISSRAQFFLWAQGALQAFLQHETLICVHGDIVRMRLHYESFSRDVPDEPDASGGPDPLAALLPRIVDDWLQGGSVPRSLCPDGDDLTGRRQLLADLKKRRFGNALAHGAKEVQGEFGSFFVFLRMPNPAGARESYMAGVLLPYLHMALHRMLAHERLGKRTGLVGAKAALTKREIQVLYWVKNGKTNQEIGQILGISQPTAKNHVQAILRKLKVSNRAEAVGKAVVLRLFATGEAA